MSGRGRIKDLTGKTFGELVVLRRGRNFYDGRAGWICQCKCGKQKNIAGTSLTRGLSKTCGHHNSFKDRTGHRYGKLLVIKEGPKLKGRVTWECLCDCGGKKRVKSIELGKKVNSCGCLAKRNSTTHGLSTQPYYQRIRSAIRRCTQPHNIGYEQYGGRGIKVCEVCFVPAYYDLGMYNAFCDALGEQPSKKHSLDRIDNDGHYCFGFAEECLHPEGNLRWATIDTQGNNRRKDIRHTLWDAVKVYCEEEGLDMWDMMHAIREGKKIKEFRIG